MPAEHEICILRHAERPPILPGTFGDDLEITPEGRKSAERFGAELAAKHAVTRILSSPILRCVQTGEAIRQGGSLDVPIAPSRLFGEPSVFIADVAAAGRYFLEAGPRKVVRRLLDGEPMEGMRSPKEGTDLLLRTVLQDSPGGLTVCVTHDAILACLQNTLTGLPYEESHWPSYLESVWIKQLGGNQLQVRWRGRDFEYSLNNLPR
jgi:broad specificity phosphatase PhoE